MSIRLLQSTDDAIHNVADDIQSFIHVLMWTAAKHAPNKMTVNQRSTFLQRFDYHAVESAQGKIDFYGRGPSAVNDLRLDTRPFSGLLTLLVTFAWYSIDHDRTWVDILREAGLDLPDSEVETRISRLRSHEWMAETLESMLRSEDWRQTKDEAVEHPIGVDEPDPSRSEKRRKASMSGYSESGSRGRRKLSRMHK